MDLDDPMSSIVSELYYDFPVPGYEFKCTIPMDQQLISDGEATIKSNESDQLLVPCWSDVNCDQNEFDCYNLSTNYDSSMSSSPNSHDQSPSSMLSPSTLSHSLNLSQSTTCLSPSTSNNDHQPIIMKDNQSNRDIELLQLFESSVFNRLLEDNFIKISLQDEALAVESGLRQLELNKYHELARVVDLLHDNRNQLIDNQQEPTARFQIAIVHKHTEKLIKVVKKITSFSNLCLDDQISLLKSRFIDLCIIKSLIFIEPETRTIKNNGQQISMERCHMMNSEQFIKLTRSINPILRTDPIINLLILLICLLNPNITTNLRSNFAVRKEYILTIHLVQKYLQLRGFTINESNYEIKNLICNLEDFLIMFNAKQKIQDVARRHLGYTSQLIAEMLDINGQQLNPIPANQSVKTI